MHFNVLDLFYEVPNELFINFLQGLQQFRLLFGIRIHGERSTQRHQKGRRFEGHSQTLRHVSTDQRHQVHALRECHTQGSQAEQHSN